MISSFEIFDELMDIYTADFGWLVLDYNSRSINVEDILFWYKFNTILKAKNNFYNHSKLIN